MEDLTPSERATVANALRVAAEVYAKDAKQIRIEGGTSHAMAQLRDQFERQAKEARALADRFDN